METARLCDELVRWSSALEGAERLLGGKGGSAGLGYGVPGGNGARTRRVASVAADDAIEEVRSTRNVGKGQAVVHRSCISGVLFLLFPRSTLLEPSSLASAACGASRGGVLNVRVFESLSACHYFSLSLFLCVSPHV